MRILIVYIAKQVFIGAMLALLVLVAIDTFFGLIAELEDVGKGNYSYSHASIYTLLSVPRSVYQMFPAAVLVGSLLSLGGLASHSELIAIRAAGISNFKISGMVIIAGVLLMLVVSLIGEFAVPYAENIAQRLSVQKQQRVVIGHKNGLWLKNANRYIHIKTVFPDSRLQGVSIYQMSHQGHLSDIFYADSAFYKQGIWQLKQVKHTQLTENEVNTEHLPVMTQTDLFAEDLLNVMNVEPDTMSARALSTFVDYLEINNLDASRYRLAFWLKLFAPVSVLVMLLLALPFAFGSLRNLAAGHLVVFGIILGLVYYILSGIASHLGQMYGLSPLASATIPVLLFISVALVLMFKQRF